MNQYSFFKSLKVGDVITTDGVGNSPITSNLPQHGGAWQRYARVTEIGSEIKANDKVKTYGIKWEGIDPSMHDCFTHVGIDKETDDKFVIRKASRSERRTFIKEYLKTRVSLVEHRKSEMDAQRKDLTVQLKKLNKIATEEKINVASLIKKDKK